MPVIADRFFFFSTPSFGQLISLPCSEIAVMAETPQARAGRRRREENLARLVEHFKNTRQDLPYTDRFLMELHELPMRG